MTRCGGGTTVRTTGLGSRGGNTVTRTGGCGCGSAGSGVTSTFFKGTVGCAHGPSDALVGWLGPDDAGCVLQLPDEPVAA